MELGLFPAMSSYVQLCPAMSIFTYIHLYAPICSYMQLYAAICSYMQLSLQLTLTCFARHLAVHADYIVSSCLHMPLVQISKVASYVGAYR